jgi:glycerophosphoryl diester phosphodiesterase
LFLALALISRVAIAQPIPEESPDAAAERHRQVAERRDGVQIICHRGSAEFAHENTLEAYRASFDLGADGNEIDIRATSDGVLVCFHDDMLDHLLEAYGDVSDYEWDELRRFRFRAPGPFGPHCRVPTLVEAFDLHRRHAGLIHLDIKRPEVTTAVMELVDRMDMWDHIVQAPATLTDPRVKRCRFKAEL